MGAFVVFGSDVLDSPSVSSNSGAGNQGQGTVTVSGGSQPFEDDDIIVFTTVNETADGQLNGGSAIADIVVYDSLEDYQAGIIKYNYAPQNPGQTASIQSDVSGLGDGYVRFNSNVLQPEDGGPTVNQLFVAPGTNLADAASQPGGITLDRNQDIDFNNDGNFDDPLEEGDNLFYVGDYTAAVVCFTAGTKILTPKGEVNIEDLKLGDHVVTVDNGNQPVRWVGCRRVRAHGRMAPVCIAENTFGVHRSLEVSQNHRILRRGPAISLLFADREVLVAAKHLVDNRNVTIRNGGWVTYVHVLFDDHELVWANGLLSESLLPSIHSISANNYAQLEALDEFRSIFGTIDERETDPTVQAARRCLIKREALLLLAEQ